MFASGCVLLSCALQTGEQILDFYSWDDWGVG